MIDSDQVVEADVDSRYSRETAASLAYEFGVNPSWQTLSGVLGAERFERLARVSKRYGVSPASLERMRPWLAALQVSYAAMNAVGFEGDLGVERTVLTAAKGDNDKVQALETVEAQIKALAKLDGNDMLANVDRTISEIDDVGGTMQPMLQAWRTGDTAALDRLVVADLRKRSRALEEKRVEHIDGEKDEGDRKHHLLDDAEILQARHHRRGLRAQRKFGPLRRY